MSDNFFIQRRQAPRAQNYNNDITLVCDADTLSAQGENLSSSGIGIKTSRRLNKEDGLTVSFYLSGTSEPVTMKGVVRWQDRAERNSWSYRTGIEFTDADFNKKKLISQSIISREISEEEKIEFESLRQEILKTADNLTAIETTTWTVTMALIGTSLGIDSIYFALLPLVAIELGFRLYKTGANKIRRIAAYLRSYMETRYPSLRWEGSLYYLRSILHGKDKCYTFEYYNIALYLSGICFAIGTYRLVNVARLYFNDSVAPGDLLLSASAYLVVLLTWFSNRLPFIKKHSRELEGAEDLEKRYYHYWEQIKLYKNGLCRDLFHPIDALHAVIDRKKLLQISDITELYRSECENRITCEISLWIDRFIKKLENPEDRGMPRRINYLFIVCVFLCAGILWGFIYFAYPAWQSFFASSFWQKNKPLYIVSLWLKDPFGLLLLVLLVSMVVKVRIKEIYFSIRNKKNRVIVLDREWLFPEKKVSAEDKLVGDILDFTAPEVKIVTLFYWLFYYGRNPNWARNRVSFLKKKWGRESEYFVRYLWLPMKAEESA